jgi:hypothetical protein
MAPLGVTWPPNGASLKVPQRDGQLPLGPGTARDWRPIARKGAGIGGRLPTYRFITRNRRLIASWLVVMEIAHRGRSYANNSAPAGVNFT